ncbi:hypothetical protein GLYMA_09G120900v4 [Glycine max]|uniref:GTD-binding domain-containing protein n=2 Tax=Glycine subgen. Soja TaxID=1462606 RepID=K7LDE8_SOYBN|nr:myosin-binding protein 3 isoform X2 [Glycine max]XP_028181088.1 myosin-binding protein 3-like isoform X2 [Glycine soja]KAH1042674.1 hypothetical protein GYH30_024800 [Glycine max]KRH38244.1 hypothetical protein GLYMA_09G120900v4 [Glycine max]RZB91738.1 Myosin-binding protein 2 isoform C [Glycine soja]|eukprot:XP_006587251.1 myosin-binding protein 3 isoform X2 [Glycine max]
MATNKFATMLLTNTNKITLVLVYAILEWILIFLLLLNSFFSYLIMKFVIYFGLKRPCIWCTRIDRIIEPENNKGSCRDLVCEAHAFEISKLDFCLNHRKLAESETMCEDCSSSCHQNFVDLSQSFGFFSWMQQKGMIHDADDNNKVLETGVEPLKCSCCGVNFVRDKPSLRVLDYSQKQNSITECGVEAEIDEGHHHSDHDRDDFELDHPVEEQNIVENRENSMVFYVNEGSGGGGKGADDISVCSMCDGGKETVYGENYKLDLGIGKGQEEPTREETLNVPRDDQPCEETTHQVSCTSENTEQIPPKHLEFVIHESAPVIENWHTSGDTVSLFSDPGCTKVFKANGFELRSEHLEQNYLDMKFAQSTEDSSINGNVEANMKRRDVELCSVVPQVSEGVTQMRGDELEAEVSTQDQDILEDSSQQIQEVPPSSSTTFTIQDDSENLHQLRKRLQLLGRKESGTEESLEGSVMCDIECGELTIEKLKSALKAEREALNVVYAELEEERSASAIAANQTMAVINRLQEEKAAMQMEALQYERMMEEQSEYDQEALQLLNDLMVKREKEKLELEKEVEIYRKKVHEYEVREMVMSRRESHMRSRTSPSCSNALDSDELSIDLSRDLKKKNGNYTHQEFSNQNAHEDAVLYLEESLENFEEERLLILEQLNMLEEKLVTLNYEEEYFDGIKSIEHLCEENGNGYQDHNDYIVHVNGLANAKHQDGRKTKCTKAENGVMSNGLDFTSLQNSSDENVQLEKKKLDVKVEVDHVYERLQALEADREFLKHCISSLGKGDKGLDLIQEILQHLRDLRNVELRIMNMGDISV